MSDRTPPKLTDILQKLMKKTAEQPAESQDVFGSSNSRLTGLGVPVIKQENGNCFIDMSGIKVFSGIVEFVRVLQGRFAEEYENTNADILIHQPVNPAGTPELSRLGVKSIYITVRSGTAKHIFLNQDVFQRHLHSIFYAIQTAQWGGLLFPAYYKIPDRRDETRQGKSELPALLFPFHLDAASGSGENGYMVLLEYDPGGKFLRLTIENSMDSRLNLKRIFHRVVANIERQASLIDTDKIAEQLCQGIHRECQNQQDEFSEMPARQPELFDILITSGLINLKKITVRWNVEAMRSILLDKDRGTHILLSKILHLLQDADMIKILGANNLLEMASDGNKVYFDVSRCGACLNISLEEKRRKTSISDFLDRMPALKSTTAASAVNLAGYRILLIHHATSEIVGFVKALEELKCARLTTLFVKYKGIVPDHYIEALFTLPEDKFKFYSLQRMETYNSVEAGYVLSGQYSSINELRQLDARFLNDRPDFFNAMLETAAHLFFIELQQAKANGQKLIIIEDGGYLAPLINKYCLENKTLKEALELFKILPLPVFNNELSAAGNSPAPDFKSFIEKNYSGSIEHTRNGFDLLQEFNDLHGKLAFPALSIAVSILKNTEEARECAVSILNAFETILHSCGLILSSRNILILGCRGNIGGNLMRQLSSRIKGGSLQGTDLAAGNDSDNRAGEGGTPRISEYRSPESMKDERLFNLDTFIGVIGKSTIKPELLEKIILRGARQALFFVSGSTKAVEFKDLAGWLQNLQTSENPVIGGVPVKIAVTHLKDAQTGVIHGNKVRIIFGTTPECALPFKDLYLLGDLMPLNFLYYGVPTEIMDLIFAQLMRLTLGFTGKTAAGETLPSKLLAIDRNIDEQANLL